ncbi:MAG: phosphodiester glycosidase family protein [Planctomycetota bacterium]|nr:phosphodiester glycosidase family protein [Planctomycetota bacterium]MDA1141676.1 phosphodiester glycosidase family protein [Planctomycetota bacterium]
MVLVTLFAGGCVTVPMGSSRSGIEYSHLVRSEPRPLQIHILRIDLQKRKLAIDVAPDPDGAGEAETVLVLPLDHARRAKIVAGVNANAWSMVPRPPKGEHPHYVVDAACDIAGWVLVDGVERSPVQPGYWSFWLDRDGTPSLGNIVAPVSSARWAVAGFGGLLTDGKILPGQSEQRHPRTALGLDREGRFLVLVAVDGRQPGYSEGMSTRELAELMLELGCASALNLDGGGSTSMVLRDEHGELRIMNRPSDRTGPRPVPILFGVR